MIEYRYFSPSALSLFFYSPNKWYKRYIEGVIEKDPETEAQLLGSVVHCLLLRKDDFDKEFLIPNFKVPTAPVKAIVDKIYRDHCKDTELNRELEDFTQEILWLCQESDYNMHLKSDDARVKKVIEPGKEYFQYLKSAEGKRILTQENYDKCLLVVEKLKSDPTVLELLAFESKEENYFEVQVQEKYNAYFGLKGVLDNYRIDHAQKTIFLNDLKVTTKKLNEFVESVNYWRYDRQIAIYAYMLCMKYDYLLADNYRLKAHFIVVDKDNDVYCFPIKEETLLSWFEKMKEELTTVSWHIQNDKFNLPYEFERGLIAI